MDEQNYSQGKTRNREAVDSLVVIAYCVVAVFLVVLAAVAFAIFS